jgi:hypothetical protein
MLGRCVTAILAIVLASLAAPAGAQVADTPALGLRQHDGFFLQLQPGPAYLHLGYTDEESSIGHRINVGGPGFGLNVALGLALTENLVVFGEGVYQFASSPTAMDAGRAAYEHEVSSVAFINVGPGAAYYFGGSGFFLSGSIGMAVSKEEGDDSWSYWSNDYYVEVATPYSAESTGLGVRAGGGKEWWIGDQWALGVAANLFYASLDSDRPVSSVNARSIALSLSATYN